LFGLDDEFKGDENDKFERKVMLFGLRKKE